MKKILIIPVLILFGSSMSFAGDYKTKQKGKDLVLKMIKKVGDYQLLLEKKDVIYNQTTISPDGKKNVSREKYIFNGELSYGKNTRINPNNGNLSETIEQGYDGQTYWMKINNKLITDQKQLERVAFSRPTRFYWFTMLQKLADPGVNYEYKGEKKIDGTSYDIVVISFDKQDKGPTDIYQLYINKKTHLVDQFLFTVAAFGKMDNPSLMRLEYEKIENIYIPSVRRYTSSNWDADVSDPVWKTIKWTNITFNNSLTIDDFKANTMTSKTPLTDKLEEKKANANNRPDSDKKRKYAEGLVAVSKSGVVQNAKQVGDAAPNFSLPNALGETVQLKNELAKGIVVLTWYRGGWCPYCNLTLHELQNELPNFKLNGATLIALSPELPDNSISTAEKHKLEFEVLSDVGNKVAHEFGIVFKLTDDVAEIYNKSFDMNKHNGDQSNELPLAATYIIDQEGKILYAFLDADYRNRAEPSEITKFLESLK